MIQPGFHFCADEIQVSMLEILKASREKLKKPREELRRIPCDYAFCNRFRLRKAADNSLLTPECNERTFLRHMVVCPKVLFPGSNTTYVYQQKCMFGECVACNAFRESDQCPRRFGDATSYKYMKYETVQTNTSTVKELKTVKANGSELLHELKSTLADSLKHHTTGIGRIRQRRHRF
jgi:hypothetical protein